MYHREIALAQAEIGIIGGSGLYSMKGLTDVRELSIETPFGPPSDPYVLGTLAGRKVAFLARHGRGHRLLPTELNFRANIHGFKQLGVERILSVSAVGSLKEEHKPTDFVIPDQFFDRTRQRVSTFFGEGIVAHIGFGEPICSELAREAEICYVTIAMVTDYDCWHPGHDSVTVEQIVAVLNQNAENACNVVRSSVAALGAQRSCKCGEALATAIMTARDAVPAATLKKLDLIVGKYLAKKAGA